MGALCGCVISVVRVSLCSLMRQDTQLLSSNTEASSQWALGRAVDRRGDRMIRVQSCRASGMTQASLVKSSCTQQRACQPAPLLKATGLLGTTATLGPNMRSFHSSYTCLADCFPLFPYVPCEGDGLAGPRGLTGGQAPQPGVCCSSLGD